MYTTLDLLKDLTPYPIPLCVIEEAAQRRMLALNIEADTTTLLSAEYNLVKADLLSWLSLAPAVSQGGQSYSFSEEQRRVLRSEAHVLLDRYSDTTKTHRPVYGYKGSRL